MKTEHILTEKDQRFLFPPKPQNNYVLGFAFDKQKSRLVLIEKKKPAWQAGLLNGVGGKVEDFDHSNYFAMVREFKEETGIETVVSDWENFAVMEGKDNPFMVTCYRAFLDNINEARTLTEETVTIVDVKLLVPNSKLATISNIPWLVAMALDRDDNFFAEVNYYAR